MTIRLWTKIKMINLYDYLHNKTICLVGGKNNFEIGDQDIVVRVNQHVLRQGGRCDGLITEVVEPCELKNLPIPPIFMGYRMLGTYTEDYKKYAKKCPIRFDFQNEKYDKINPHGVEYEWSNILNWEMNAKPFTGMLALKFLTFFPIKSVFVTGMDMHINSCDKLKTLDDKIILRRDAHDIAPQLQWLRQISHCDKRIILCDDLIKVIYG